MQFSTLALGKQILRAVSETGYTTLTPIQAQAIPAVLAGKDVMAAAQTGTGKTAGFTLPILERLSSGNRASAHKVRALILTPTRELAAQVEASVTTYGKHLPLRSGVVFGGVGIQPQKNKLAKGLDILVATPGRLLDLYQQGCVRFDTLEILVLDEADRMLDMGFIHDIRRILTLLPKQRQNLMFSATFSSEIRKLAKTMVHNPVEIAVDSRNSTAQRVRQWICPVDKKSKGPLLQHLIREHNWHQVLVFSRTKHGANRLAGQLDKSGISAAAIHGNKSQGARTRALGDFKKGKVQVLVATDIAARGLDINELPQVVNFDLPNVPEDYVHRIGRTGRAGREGQAVSLVSADEIKQLADIEKLIGNKLTREMVQGFVPDHDLPDSKTPTKPRSGNRHKKPAKAANDNAGPKSRSGGPRPPRRKPGNKNSGGPGRSGNGNRKSA